MDKHYSCSSGSSFYSKTKCIECQGTIGIKECSTCHIDYCNKCHDNHKVQCSMRVSHC